MAGVVVTEAHPRRRQQRELAREDALRLLGSVRIGRIVFTERAMPAIRPVNHVVDDGEIYVRTHSDAAVMTAVGQVVAYEADDIASGDRVGWSVIVTGKAEHVRDSVTVARYERLIDPWVDRHMDQLIRIHPEIVSGYALATST